VSAKAVAYAETVLGVHSVYTETQELLKEHDDVLDQITILRDHKRVLEFSLADREQELIQLAWVSDPDMSAARFDKHIKSVYHSDTGWKNMRRSLAQALSDIDTHEAALKQIDARLKTAQSRMIELGGYLNYLAAVKNAASTPPTEKS
jgi:hypothetical protein